MRSPLARTLGVRIREGRVVAGIGQVELADKFGVTQSTVSKWELGWVVPDLATVLALAALLGFSVDDLTVTATVPASTTPTPCVWEVHGSAGVVDGRSETGPLRRPPRTSRTTAGLRAGAEVSPPTLSTPKAPRP